MASERERDFLKDIILNEQIRTVFQPIVDVVNVRVAGYEALSRGPKGSELERPDKLFQVARDSDLLWDTEFLCRRLAIERASALELKDYLFLNVDPGVIKDRKFREGMTSRFIKNMNMDPCRIIFEITEKTAIEDYRAFKEVLDHYVRQGYKIAIDDTGAGYSGIRLITETKPQFIKLDMELIRDIDMDSFKQALCRNLLMLSKITNMKLVAEGVENINELNTLIDIGVEYIQGFFVARPSEILCDISDELKKHIRLLNYNRKNEKFHTARSFPVGRIARFDVPISVDTGRKEIGEIFKDSKVQGLVVVNNGSPVGLIMKNTLSAMVEQEYEDFGCPVNEAEIMMFRNPLIVDFDTSVYEASKLAMSRVEENLYDYVIVIQECVYYGIVTIKRLLECAAKLELKEEHESY